MYDGIFLINNALAVNQLSVFNNDQRFEQTVETLKSIDERCPNNVKVMFDNSPENINEDHLKVIGNWPNTWFLDMGKHPVIQSYSMNGLRSLAETFAFSGALQWLREQDFEAKRFYKLSGRYTLTDDFILDDPSYEGAFVFANSLDSWMSQWKQARTGVRKLYRLRLWHMDYKLLPEFHSQLPMIFTDCGQYDIDVEHAYYKNLHKYKVIEVPKIGVTGTIAPSGEFIDE